MFRPDETAEGRAVAIARRNDPAANQNAASVVIHPLHPPRSGETADSADTTALFNDPDRLFARTEETR